MKYSGSYVVTDRYMGSWLSSLFHKVTGTKSGAEKDAEKNLTNDAVNKLTTALQTPSLTNDSTPLIMAGVGGLAVIVLLMRKPKKGRK